MIIVQMSSTLHDRNLHYMFHKGILEGNSFNWIKTDGGLNGIYSQHCKILGVSV